MCDKCDEMWGKYKRAEHELAKAKQAYTEQSKKCANKEPEPEPEKPIPKEEQILREHDFMESQGKPGLYFRKPGEDSVVFIDLRKGAPRAYGFCNDQSMDHGAVHEETKSAVNAIRMLTSKASGQTELGLSGGDE